MRISKNKEERRQELISVALRLFSERGFAETSVQDIVRETGVAQGTFYYHFRSKDELLIAVVQTMVQKFDQQLIGIVQNTAVPPAERIRTLLAAIFEHIASNCELIAYVHMDANALLHHRLMGTTAMMIRKHLLSLVNEGISTGDFHVTYPEEAVHFFLGGITGVLHPAPEMSDGMHNDRFQAMVETALLRVLIG